MNLVWNLDGQIFFLMDLKYSFCWIMPEYQRSDVSRKSHRTDYSLVVLTVS